MSWITHHIALVLFAVLAIALFCGFPVAFVLGGVAIMFGGIGILLGVFEPVQFFNLLPRSTHCTHIMTYKKFTSPPHLVE